MILNSLNSFISTVDPNKATVTSFPQFIALYGGVTSPNHAHLKVKSQRALFYQWVLEYRQEFKGLLLLSDLYDDIGEYYRGDDFTLLERDIGYLTSAILMFLESSDTIVKYGVFSQIQSLCKKLVIVVTDDYQPKKTFISLEPIYKNHGTIRYPNSFCIIPKGELNTFIKYIPNIIEIIDKKIKLVNGRESFNKKNPQHEILLVLDLINLFLTIRFTEIQHLVSHFGLELGPSRLNQILFLLDKTGLITRQRYGNNLFYIPRNFKKRYIKYSSYSSGCSFRREGLKTSVWKEIQGDSYRRRVYEFVNAKRVGEK